MFVTIYLNSTELKLAHNSISNEFVREVDFNTCTQLSKLLGTVGPKSELTPKDFELLCTAITNEAVLQTNHTDCMQLAELLGNVRIQSELTPREKHNLCISSN